MSPSLTNPNPRWIDHKDRPGLRSSTFQPCNPTLPNARAAWIQADQNRYDGA
ncbi:uncharacterized protein ARMOST_21474 [Armillaria ostoyae]|uniref:Extracellular metalloproteinase n=1 Tax=Armillaria ostoyae TaxID=47428 RepID=A0A284SAA1_ARMOS|nr:uncharacterized protein ARMOST_21474 [Armillaria ostoyae]